MRTRPFYRAWNGAVTSLRALYDVTGDVPIALLTVPGNVGKRLNCSRERLKKKEGGATVVKTQGLGNRTGAKG